MKGRQAGGSRLLVSAERDGYFVARYWCALPFGMRQGQDVFPDLCEGCPAAKISLCPNRSTSSAPRPPGNPPSRWRSRTGWGERS